MCFCGREQGKIPNRELGDAEMEVNSALRARPCPLPGEISIVVKLGRGVASREVVDFAVNVRSHRCTHVMWYQAGVRQGVLMCERSKFLQMVVRSRGRRSVSVLLRHTYGLRPQPQPDLDLAPEQTNGLVFKLKQNSRDEPHSHKAPKLLQRC